MKPTVMASSTTTTSTYTLIKYSRSYPSASQTQQQEWQHFVNPTLQLVLDTRKSQSGELESVRLRVLWTLENSDNGADVDERPISLEDVDLLTFSNALVAPGIGVHDLPLRAVYRDAVVGIRYRHVSSQLHRRFQISFQSSTLALRFVDSIRYICPCKANPPSVSTIAHTSLSTARAPVATATIQPRKFSEIPTSYARPSPIDSHLMPPERIITPNSQQFSSVSPRQPKTASSTFSSTFLMNPPPSGIQTPSSSVRRPEAALSAISCSSLQAISDITLSSQRGSTQRTSSDTLRDLSPPLPSFFNSESGLLVPPAPPSSVAPDPAKDPTHLMDNSVPVINTSIASVNGDYLGRPSAIGWNSISQNCLEELVLSTIQEDGFSDLMKRLDRIWSDPRFRTVFG